MAPIPALTTQQLSAIASQPNAAPDEEPAKIIIQVNPKPTIQNTANTNADVEKTTGQPIVRSANEALQILETHRNQSKDETNDLKQNQTQNHQHKPTGDCN